MEGFQIVIHTKDLGQIIYGSRVHIAAGKIGGYIQTTFAVAKASRGQEPLSTHHRHSTISVASPLDGGANELSNGKVEQCGC